MTDAPTPGQVAYAAYCETRDPWWHPDFTLLPPEAQHCWEVAAQAVLTWKPAPAVVHRLRAGVPLCGFSREAPVHWPAGHRWSAFQADITCPTCQEVSHG
jgi:hypothetical protein